MRSKRVISKAFAAITWIVAGYISLISAGCARVPDLPDLFRASERVMPYDARLRGELAAPIIIVGLVETEEEVGRPRRSRGDPKLGVQLTRVEVLVEQVLRGSASRGTLTFYYYGFSPHSEAEPPHGIGRYHAFIPVSATSSSCSPFPEGTGRSAM